MEKSSRGERQTARLNAAATFLETVRGRFPNGDMLRLFDSDLVEYQAALITLLMSEELHEAGGEAQAAGTGEAGRQRGQPMTHVQRVIANAQQREQYQLALARYLETRRRLATTMKQFMAVSDTKGLVQP